MVTIATDYRKRIFRGAKIEELETISRRLAENSLEQSKNNQNETVQESNYKDDIPKEAMEELKDIAPNFQKGMFEGMRFAYEQVANYISIMLATSDKLNEKHINNVLQHIQKNSFIKEDVEETAETYQKGLTNGIKAGFNMADLEIKGRFQIQT